MVEATPSQMKLIPSEHSCASGTAAPSPPTGSTSWFLFFLLTAALFLRPEEIVPAVAGASIYQWLILACICASSGALLGHLQPRALREQPITLCVLGLLTAVVLSDLQHLHIGDAVRHGFVFFKVAVYYVLLVTCLNSPARLRQYLVWLAVFTSILTLLSLLQYHRLIDLPWIRVTDRDVDTAQIDERTGHPVNIERLQSVGIFGNPNDFARLLMVGVIICLFEAMRRPLKVHQLLWLVPMATMAYALKLTYSRGGLLALAAGLGVLFRARYGWGKTILLAVVMIPGMALFFGGRQTDMDVSGGTGQQRIQIWSDGLARLRESPLLGIGMDHYVEEVGYVAHNSFVHCFVELGIVGGTLFTGAVYVACAGLYQLGRRRADVLEPEMRRLGISLAAIMAAYIVGMLSSARSYSEFTYALLGLIAAYLGLVRVVPAIPVMRVDWPLARRLAAVGLCVLGALYAYVRVFAHFGALS